MLKKFIIFFLITFLYSINSFSECIKPVMPSNEEWKAWLNDISNEAIEYGINKSIVDKEFYNILPLEKIIMRDRCQPESTITFKEYLYYRLDKTRIYRGKLMKKKFLNDLNEIALKFKIQPSYILAIWGLESSYGKNQGQSKIIHVLATLTYDQRRSSFYKKQLFAALQILEKNIITSDKLIGSWAGAMGQVQFLPTTYLESAFDYDEDGKKDIWNNELDAFASIANYLTSIDKAPWNSNQSWGIEVTPPQNISSLYESFKQINPKGCYAVKSMSVEKSLNEWKRLGFINASEKNIHDNNILGRLVAPDGIEGKMYIVFKNYKTILYYNCSHYYAITVGLLSDMLSK